MFQSTMKELEKQLNCSQNHNQPLHMVVFDSKLKGQERLLCTICMETFESESKTIGFKKVMQMIEEKQKNKVDNIQSLIQGDLNLVEQFQNKLHQIKQNLIKQLDDLISNSKDWINSLNQIVTDNSKYSFYDELELLISYPNQNKFNQKQIIDQIKVLNSSFCTKINLKLCNLKNLELYSECEKQLEILNFSHDIKLIDNTNYQTEVCYAISFNSSGSLMISASNQDIRVWSFVQGRLQEITTLKGHSNGITCLCFSQKCNNFVSAGYDNSIKCWKQINEKVWTSSLSYQKHTNCINCLILNQSENLLASGGRDHSIKIWQIDFTRNELTYLYSLDKHIKSVYSLCFNQSENTLVSCGKDKQIIMWKQNNLLKWQFEYLVTQTVQEFGCRLYFINDDQFIWVPGHQVSNDCISMFELKDGKYQENLLKEAKLIKNDKNCDQRLCPIFYNSKKNLMILKHKNHVYLIKISNEGKLNIIKWIKYESNFIQGALSNDGRYLITWDKSENKYKTYEILIN